MKWYLSFNSEISKGKIEIWASSEIIGETSKGAKTPSQNRMDFVNSVIQGIDLELQLGIQNDEDELIGADEDGSDDEAHYNNITGWRMWANSLEDSAKRISGEDRMRDSRQAATCRIMISHGPHQSLSVSLQASDLLSPFASVLREMIFVRSFTSRDWTDEE
ncbi:hypothetical protein LSTR_LSTR003642 [Laodelphax striatellus]|uniref:Uncharacterized protein n=1 Tax=Laodelphax striatellus TaxID=195883 RepID=A0A482XBH3_LAOST|nr:hypothetical protein LSTR_LSTR003642 [Laodelphax striatellus]